jgi:hypothetical protein
MREDNIKVDKSVNDEWIHLVQDRVQWSDPVNMVRSLGPLNGGKFE